MSDLKDELKYPRGISDGTYMWVEKLKLDDLVRELERERKRRHELRKEFDDFLTGDRVGRLNIGSSYRISYHNIDEFNHLESDIKHHLMGAIHEKIQEELHKYNNLPWWKRLFTSAEIKMNDIRNLIQSEVSIDNRDRE